MIFFACVVIVTMTLHAQAAEPESELSLALVADPHFDVVGQQGKGFKLYGRTREIVSAVVQELNEGQFDRVLMPGDMLRDGEPTNLDVLREMLEELAHPYRVIFGNHDYAPPGKPGISKAAFARAFAGRGFSSEEYYSAESVGPMRIIYLDSTRIGRVNGHIDRRQLNWLRSQLEAHPDAPTIVMLHHPLIPAHPDDAAKPWSRVFMVQEPKETLELLESSPQVKMVIHGHHHMSAVNTQKGIHHISVPSVMSYPCAYMTLRVIGDKVEYDTIPVPVEGLEAQARKAVLEQTSFFLPSAPDDKEKLLTVLKGEKKDRKGVLTFR